MKKCVLTVVFFIFAFVSLSAQVVEGTKVSVVIPAYNVEEFIEESVNSVLTQTHKNLEVIVVDDTSKDSTYEKLSKLAAKDKRIKLFKNPENQGANATRNIGFSHVSGEYVYFLDSDDYLNAHFIEKMLSFALQHKADVVVTVSSIGFSNETQRYEPFFVTETAKRYFKNREDIPYLPQEELLQLNRLPAAPWTKFCKTSFLRDNNIRFLDERVTYGDSYWTTILIANTKKFYVIWAPPYFLRYREGSMQDLAGTSKGIDKLTDYITVSSRVYDYLKANNLFDKGKVNIEALKLRLRINVNKRKYYNELRPFFISIKDDVLKHKAAYHPHEIAFLKSVIRHETLESYERAQLSPETKAIIIMAIPLVILVALRFYLRRKRR